MKKTIIAIVFTFLSLLILMTFSGCVLRPTPSEYFDSLQELKDSISNNSSILFPDTTDYVFVDSVKFSKVYRGKSNILEGYSYGGDLIVGQSDTHLSSIYFICEILDVAYDDRNPAPKLDANTKILGVDLYEKITDQSENPDYLASGNFQEGSKIIGYIYQFDLNGCRYSISAHLIILPEELDNLNSNDVDAKVEDCKNEVLYLVESIIKQEEIVK